MAQSHADPEPVEPGGTDAGLPPQPSCHPEPLGAPDARSFTTARASSSTTRTSSARFVSRPIFATPSSTPSSRERGFRFLKDLKRNNDRDFFEANKARFVADVKDPLLRFITDVAPKLAKISPEIVADPRPNGGSMFRIYRDVRFSSDKSPYKTHAAAPFRHVQGKDVHAPGYYLHLEPGTVFMGAGMWRPDSASLANIRNAIVDDPAAWKRLVGGKVLRETFSRQEESLKRAPRGFDAEHPLVDELKLKHHILVANFDEAEACEADFLNVFAQRCRQASRYMAYLATANDLRW